MTYFPQKMKAALILAAFSSITVTASLAQTAPTSTLLQFDFNGANPWPKAAADVMPSTPIDVLTTIETAAVGTMDEAASTRPSGGLLIKTEVGEVGLPWIATYSSGMFPVRNAETNLANLALSLDLSASSARPLMVRIESFNARRNRTGGLETTLNPAAPDVYERFTLDFSKMSTSDDGKFNPTDPHLQITLELRNPAWPDKATHELRIDNVLLTAGT